MPRLFWWKSSSFDLFIAFILCSITELKALPIIMFLCLYVHCDNDLLLCYSFTFLPFFMAFDILPISNFPPVNDYPLATHPIKDIPSQGWLALLFSLFMSERQEKNSFHGFSVSVFSWTKDAVHKVCFLKKSYKRPMHKSPWIHKSKKQLIK